MPKKNFDFIFKTLLICAVFLSAWNYIFFSFPKIAQAEIINAPWNITPLDNKIFTWQGRGFATSTFENFDILIDENGYSFWREKQTDYNYLVGELKLVPFDTPQNNLTQGPATGEKLWIASELYGSVENGFHYTDNSGTERTSAFEGFINNFSVAGTTIYLKNWTGFGNYDQPFKKMWVETPHIAGRIYFIVYTNQDLSFINSQSTLYSYLNSLNQNATNSPQVWGIDPVTGSEVSDLFTNFKIGYKNLNFDEIDGLIIGFKNDQTKLNSELNVVIDKENLDPSGSGISDMSLKSFYFDTKGKWNLEAFGFKTWGYDIKQNQIATDNLVFDPYFLNLIDSTLKTPFTFSLPDTWYANHSRYATSTAFFSDFVGLISPVFETIGNFAVGIKDIFNTDQAYQTGYSFGAVLPLINGYVERIDDFFGGFPLGTIFKYCIWVLIAIFIIRLIFKFIPFFG